METPSMTRNSQPRSQGLSSLPLSVVGTETLVAADHVTIYPSKTAEWVGTQVNLVERTIKYHHVAPPFQQIFLPPRFWVVTWPAATRVSVPTTKGGREERPWERGWEIRWTRFRYPVTSWSVVRELKHQRRQRQRKRHLKINICEMVTIFRLLPLACVLYCWQSTLQMDW